MKKHFLHLLFPGSFASEESVSEVSDWDVDAATSVAEKRKQQIPFGFYFTTRARAEDDLDNHVTETSGIYYLGGKLLTVADIEKKEDPGDKILLSNMRNNEIGKIIENNNSCRVMMPFRSKDILLNVDLTQGNSNG